MPGICNGLIGHCEQFGADSCHKRLVVTVREIGTAITALENHIACKDAFLLLVPEYQAAGRVSGNMQNVQSCMSKTDCITFMKHIFRFYGIDMTVISDSEYCQPGIDCPDPWHIQIVGLCLYTVCILNKRVAKYVVKMQMGVE